jgi:serine/threonine protein kinase
MSRFPDLSDKGYLIQQVLGQNHEGGRITYQAIDMDTQQPVVIKQFQFACLNSPWSDYSAYRREIQILKLLDHPGIPRYLDSFETPMGFCLVQEYKSAPSLARSQRHWTPNEVKQIAIEVLQILMYLQRRVLPVIHRDIKPDNILADYLKTLKVYLVDFGFAHAGTEKVAASSVIRGTLGFMPPEQILGRQLTLASDLYGLGATLICLLTQTPSTQVRELIEPSYRFNIKELLPFLNPEFTQWLQTMVEPDPAHRFPDAASALQALQLIEVEQAQPA